MPNAPSESRGTDPFERAVVAARELARRSGVERHDAVLVLGTGLAGVAPRLGASGSPIDLSSLPWFQPFHGIGHRAVAWSVPAGSHRLLVMAGRSHLYEGLSAAEVTHALRTAIASGCGTVLLTCAAGALTPELAPGQVTLVRDHLNLTGASPLTGLAPGGQVPSPFVDLTDAWSPRLRTLAKQAEPSLVEGIYAQVPGPHLETPAEVRALAAMGAHLVGMSLAIEAIAARHLGAEVLGLAVVTNFGPGVAPGGATAARDRSDRAITEVAAGAAAEVGRIVSGVIARLGDAGPSVPAKG